MTAPTASGFFLEHLRKTDDRIGQLLGVLTPLPGSDTAGVDCLDSVALRRPDVPGQEVPCALDFTLFQKVQNELIVGHQDAAGLVDIGRVVQFAAWLPASLERSKCVTPIGVVVGFELLAAVGVIRPRVFAGTALS